VEFLFHADVVGKIRKTMGPAEQPGTTCEFKRAVHPDLGRPFLAGKVGFCLQEREIELRVVNHQGIVADALDDLRDGEIVRTKICKDGVVYSTPEPKGKKSPSQEVVIPPSEF
jgi:hypothetical protein